MKAQGAKLGMSGWGRGCWSAPDEGGRGSAQPNQQQMSEDDYRSMSADEGIATLTGDFAEVKPDLNALGEEGFPGPIAEAMFWDDGAVVGIQGPVGSGKTTTLLKSRLRRAKMSPISVIDGVRRYKLLAIRETYRNIWSTTIPDFLKVFPKNLGDWSGGRGGPVTFVMRFEDEFGLIEFTAEFMAFGDDIVASLRGYQATDIWLHEMDTNPEDVLANGITRIGRFPDQKHFAGYPAHVRNYGQIVGDMNAMDQDNYCFGLFHQPDRREEILKQINATLPEGAPKIEINFHRQPGFGEDGCENLHNLPPSYYAKQIATLTLAGKGDLIDRLVYNKTTYLRIGAPVFLREFNRSAHVAPRMLVPDPAIPLRVGLDQGFLGAAVVGQFLPPGRWQIYGVMMFPKERLFAKEFGRRLAVWMDEHWPGAKIEAGWGDMAGEQGSSLSDDENATWNLLVGRTAGFRIRPQKLGQNRIQPRLEAVRAALEAPMIDGMPGLLISPTLCEPLISGFEARYVWTDEIDKSGDKRKVPNKNVVEANAMDALQYLLLSESKADGTSKNSFPGNNSTLIGHNGGPPLGASSRGLITDFDVLDPYGEYA